MTRRQLLQAAVALFAVAVLPSLPEPIADSYVMKREAEDYFLSTRTFSIAFPDGTLWTFDGVITALSPDRMSILPHGMPVMTESDTFPSPRQAGAQIADPLQLVLDDGDRFDIMDISIPSLTRRNYQLDDETIIQMPLRRGSLSFTGKFA